ncbi:hypothetical protein EVAR_71659_1 [Eumeta japonica]|uniref:Uncharacterized protein n=1 Tax=Eumeta variegata TaxID=151549 RepID=A0A4C1SZC5_EUMVA|nr:hypothetical protein EVAR_71659_1 [Eumeta japonica]
MALLSAKAAADTTGVRPEKRASCATPPADDDPAPLDGDVTPVTGRSRPALAPNPQPPPPRPTHHRSHHQHHRRPLKQIQSKIQF